MTDLAAMHNRIADVCVRLIVNRMLRAGGKTADIMITLESVIAGVVVLVASEGKTDGAVDVIAGRVKNRIRAGGNIMGNIKPAGTA